MFSRGDWLLSFPIPIVSVAQRLRRLHLVKVHGVPAYDALQNAGEASRPCGLCESWLRRQLEGLGKEGR